MATRNPSLNIRPDLARSALHAAGSRADDELIGPRGAWWFTGKEPTTCPGFNAKQQVLKALPLPNLSNFTRQSVLDYFDNTWTLTEVLFAALQGTEAFVRQPYHQLRHPMIFYYGHPAVLYINKFRVAGLLTDGIDQYFEQLFETGVDEMSWDDLSRARDDWPSIRTVHEYRQKAYHIIRNVIETHSALDEAEVTWDSPAWAIFMGFEHERIHLETSSVLIRELPLDFLRKPPYFPDYHPSYLQPSPVMPAEGIDYPNNDFITVAGEKVVLGKPNDFPSFGWDNEYGKREHLVSTFKASRYKVTNGEFLRFVKSGGYSNPKYWSTEGWGWKTFRNVKWPTFWIPDGPQGLHRYKLRALFDAIDMRWDWPVDVNYHEAKAYCAWKAEQDASDVKYRVITEAEHMLLRNTCDRADAYSSPVAHPPPGDAASGAANGAPGAGKNVDACMLCSGDTAAETYGFNFQLAYSSQSPVTELPPSNKGFHDAMGNAWEWCEDHQAPYPRFRVHPYYEDFTVPCFGGKHQMIIGGSFISTGVLASKYARYQFRPHFFQHATFRVVQPVVDTALYDMQRYGPENPLVPFCETSCMDAPPPYIGDGPCCSCKRRSAFTPTLEEEASSSQAKRIATQVTYESDAILSQYLSAHFGPFDRVYPALLNESRLLQCAIHFPKSCADLVSQWAQRVGAGHARAVDLGCAVGRASFELTREFQEVLGVDISGKFIEVANKLRENGRMDYDCSMEGEICERLTASLPEGVDTSRVSFMQGDACSLPKNLGEFDAVLAANLLDRVPDPQKLLSQIKRLLHPGGLAVITSPFSWLDEYANRANWIGGVYKDGLPHRSRDHLVELLSPDFEVLSEDTMPLLLPEHTAKYQLILAHTLVLQRK